MLGIKAGRICLFKQKKRNKQTKTTITKVAKTNRNQHDQTSYLSETEVSVLKRILSIITEITYLKKMPLNKVSDHY